MKSIIIDGTLKATASKNNPLQTELELVLTDFNPNRNSQQVPRTEAENIVQSALYMPLKISFKDGKEEGHDNARPIGVISEVWVTDEDIRAKSIVWNDEFPDIDRYIKERTEAGENLRTSWELYYGASEKVGDISVLKDITFAGTVIVSNPAYGHRTKIYSVAETMEELEQLKKDLETVYQYIMELWCDVVPEMEEQAMAQSVPEALDRLKTLVARWKEQEATREGEVYAELNTAKAELTEIKEKYESLVAEKAQAEAELARTKLLTERRAALASVGLTYTDEEFADETDMLTGMNDDQFARYVKNFSRVAKASVNSPIAIPDTAPARTSLSMKDLAKALKEVEN